MDLNFSKKEHRLLDIAESIIDEWREILHLDPLWRIDVNIFDDESIPGAYARVDASTTEYFFATIEISYDMLQMKEADFIVKMNDAAAHELLHLLMIDYHHSAVLAAGDNEAMREELKYKYEQFTSRLQRAFVDLYQSHIEMNKLQYKLNTIKELLTSNKEEDLLKIEKLLGINKKEEK